jgi:hypothetical protein
MKSSPALLAVSYCALCVLSACGGSNAGGGGGSTAGGGAVAHKSPLTSLYRLQPRPSWLALQRHSDRARYSFRNGGAICFDETKAINATQRSATTIRGGNSERNCLS